MYWYFTGYKILSVDEGASKNPQNIHYCGNKRELENCFRFPVIMCAILYQSQDIKQKVILSFSLPFELNNIHYLCLSFSSCCAWIGGGHLDAWGEEEALVAFLMLSNHTWKLPRDRCERGEILFSCPGQLNKWHCRSVGLSVCRSVGAN